MTVNHLVSGECRHDDTRHSRSQGGTVVNLRMDPTGPAAGRVGEVLGTEVPVEPNTVAPAGTRSVLWLGPDEWLVVAPDGDGRELVVGLRGALGLARGSAVDVSAGHTVFELIGPSARDLLEHGCPLDLHPRVFGTGRCARTLLGKAQVLLWHPEEEGYRVLVGPSFADYLLNWLTDAARD